MNGDTIKVLVVDDSAVVRGLLTRVLERDGSIAVAGTAINGEVALSWMQKHPVDVVVLDVEMPVLDGLATLERIRRDFPDVQVVMASTLTVRGGETTIRALSLGAAACVAKPATSSLAASLDQLAAELLPLVKALGGHVEPSSGRGRAVAARSRGDVPDCAVQAVVIGASTGGPQALSQVLSGLPGDFPLPVLIVQHMPATFTPILARHLGQDTGRPTEEARDGEPILRGHTYVAPGGFHTLIDKEGQQMVTRITEDPPEHYCRPSVNPLFRSAAEWYGKSVLGVVLTGMGSDGLEGGEALVDAGGTLFAQDESTSVVWGMPGAVTQAGLPHRVLPLSRMAPAILERCSLEVTA